MRKKDIKPGMLLVLRDGSRRIVREGGVLAWAPACGAKYAFGSNLFLDEYCDRLFHPFSELDINAVWDAGTGPLWWRGVDEV